jgi:hypothetical protein
MVQPSVRDPSVMFALFHLAEKIANGGKLDAVDGIVMPVEIMFSLSIGSIGWYLWKTRKR